MMTEKWIPTRSHSQAHLQDGSWINYMVGVYDGRDIMSDCVKPSWERSGEFLIEVIPAGKRHNSDWDFQVRASKEWGNRIAYNIQQGRFKTMLELTEALRKLGKSQGTYVKICGHESVVIGL